MAVYVSLALPRQPGCYGADRMAHLMSDGPTSAFDCTGESDCQARLLTDFQKVREVGFNTLRVVGGFGAHYRDTPEHGPDERRFGMFLHRNPFPNNNHDHDRIHVDLEADMDGPYSERFFDLLIDLLDVAEQADLKVICYAWSLRK